MSKLQELVKKYPKAFISYKGHRYAFPLFGFQIGEGWADLIEPVISHLNDHNTKYENDEENVVYVNQIKEKFGGLRFYTSGSTDELNSLVEKAEEKSFVTCEVCGQPGDQRIFKGWISVNCDEHARKE